jgi:hypothetical protein
MAKKVRSARGEYIDFDLLKIKEQIASTPKTVDVKAREAFIDKKLSRRIKKVKRVAKQEVSVEPNIVDKD